MPEVIHLHRTTVREDVYPACTSETSACRGGRLPCPTPEACARAELVPAARLAALPKLTPAGKFWVGYVAGIVSALLLVHWGAW